MAVLFLQNQARAFFMIVKQGIKNKKKVKDKKKGELKPNWFGT